MGWKVLQNRFEPPETANINQRNSNTAFRPKCRMFAKRYIYNSEMAYSHYELKTVLY